MSNERVAYEAWLEALQLKHFSPREITNYSKAVRGGVTNSIPDRSLWKNIVVPLWILDQLREAIDLPIRITSNYRSPKYNKQVKGSSGSFHLKNGALDFQVDGMSPGRAFDHLNRMRHAGCFTGGLGAYPTFTHIDAGLRGRNATW